MALIHTAVADTLWLVSHPAPPADGELSAVLSLALARSMVRAGAVSGEPGYYLPLPRSCTAAHALSAGRCAHWHDVHRSTVSRDQVVRDIEHAAAGSTFANWPSAIY